MDLQEIQKEKERVKEGQQKVVNAFAINSAGIQELRQERVELVKRANELNGEIQVLARLEQQEIEKARIKKKESQKP